MPQSTNSASRTISACWHTTPSSGPDLACDKDFYSFYLSTGHKCPPPAQPISDKFPGMKAEMQQYGHFQILVANIMCSFPSCGICFTFLQLILSHQKFTLVRNLHCGRHCITASARLFLCRRSRQGRRPLFSFNMSSIDKDYVSKRLELLPSRNHSHMTPTRRTLCLTQHLYPRALPTQHSQRPHPRLS